MEGMTIARSRLAESLSGDSIVIAFAQVKRVNSIVPQAGQSGSAVPNFLESEVLYLPEKYREGQVTSCDYNVTNDE
jgi:hypothetical protein